MSMDSLRGSIRKFGTIQRRLAWALRKDDTHESRSVNNSLLSLRIMQVMGAHTHKHIPHTHPHTHAHKHRRNHTRTHTHKDSTQDTEYRE